MATLFIEEYSGVGDVQGHLLQAPAGIPINQQVTVAGTSAQSSALNAATRYVRFHADVECYVKFGTNPTAVADATSEHVVANQYIDRVVPAGGGLKIAVIEV